MNTLKEMPESPKTCSNLLTIKERRTNNLPKWFYWALLPLAFLTSCSCNTITVQSEYVDRETLASFHVGTPDPLLSNPPRGQRLIISWSLPREYACYQEIHLVLKVRFRNREEKIHNIAIHKRQGTTVYEILDAVFCESLGIQTYKIDLVGDGETLDEWRHQLWADLIRINPITTSSGNQ